MKNILTHYIYTDYSYEPSLEGSYILWACLVEGFNTPVSAGGLNIPNKRVDQDCWLRSGFESPPCFKPLSGSYQLWTLHRSNIICALLGLRANKTIKSIFQFFFSIFLSQKIWFMFPIPNSPIKSSSSRIGFKESEPFGY